MIEYFQNTFRKKKLPQNCNVLQFNYFDLIENLTWTPPFVRRDSLGKQLKKKTIVKIHCEEEFLNYPIIIA